MTTENIPVGSPAEKDDDGQRPANGEATANENAPPEVGSVAPSAVPESEEASSDPMKAPDTPTPSEVEAAVELEAPASTDLATEVESPPVEVSPSPAAESTTENTPPPRRVRLNPTVTPDALKPIPTVKTSEPPPVPAGEQSPESVADAQPTVAEDEAAPTSAPVVEEPSSAAASVDESEAETPPAEPAAPPAEPVAIPSRHESLDADLEAELEAAMASADQEQEPAVTESEAAAETPAAAPDPDMDVKRGTRLKGVVQSIHGDDMFLEFGLRMAGVLSRRQFGLRKQPMQGEPLEVVVHRVDEKEGLIHVNLPTGTSKIRGDWDALTVDQNVECIVNGTNKGGLEVSVGSLRGFMPASQVELGYVPDLNVYVGQKLKARIAEVNPKRRKLVLSRRSLLEEEREQSQQELFEKVQPGQQYTGRVKTLKDYGAFVDIGGADGLLHVAQISWTRINHPSEVLKEGEEVEVQVLSVDKEKKKISLGMRQLTQNPWKAAEAKYTQGSQVKGKVTRIENFGAFVELEEGVEGLVHISELDHKRVKKVTEVLRVGQEVDVQVLEVDPKRKRVGLSVKALKEKPEEPGHSESSAPIKRQRSEDSLVGGMGEPTGGQLFGDPSKFGG